MPVPGMLEYLKRVDVDFYVTCSRLICSQKPEFMHGVILSEFDDDEHTVVFPDLVIE